jgi:hypothetical protein
MEASFLQREKVLQFPGRRNLMDDIDPAEFVAEENLLQPPQKSHHLTLFAADP